MTWDGYLALGTLAKTSGGRRKWCWRTCPVGDGRGRIFFGDGHCAPPNDLRESENRHAGDCCEGAKQNTCSARETGEREKEKEDGKQESVV